jgi:hypothetical protein
VLVPSDAASLAEGLGQFERGPRIIGSVLDAAVLVLPAGDPRRVPVDEPVTHGLLQDAHEQGEAVLHVERLAPSPIQPETARSTAP